MPRIPYLFLVIPPTPTFSDRAFVQKKTHSLRLFSEFCITDHCSATERLGAPLKEKKNTKKLHVIEKGEVNYLVAFYKLQNNKLYCGLKLRVIFIILFFFVLVSGTSEFVTE